MQKLFILPAFFLSILHLTAQVKPDTITNFQNQNLKKAIFKAPNGKTYKVQFRAEKFVQLEADAINLVVNCTDSVFVGQDRKAAKTSFATTPTVDFTSIAALFNSLPKDAVMQTKVTKNSSRVPVENKNVRLKNNIYLLAFKKESDNDYHVIIGDNKDFKKATLLNAEISGLPAPLVKQFQMVRNAFEKQFVQVCSNSYAIFTANPISIQIEGSVFYDIDHKPGQIGPAGLQPKTSWEIHPIAKITFQ